MEKNKWNLNRLFRSALAMLLMLSMLLVCGCVEQKPGETEPSTPDAFFGDGDGKLEAQDAIDCLTNIYGALLSAAGGNEKQDVSYKVDMALKLGDQILASISQSMHQSGLDVDTAWLEKIGITMETKTAGDLMQMILAARLGDQDIISGDMIIDAKEGKGYMGVPELNPQYIYTPVAITGTEALDRYVQMAKELPTDAQLNEVLTRYLNVILENLNKPVDSTETMTIGAITKELVTTTYTFTTHNTMDIYEKILTEAKTDTQLETVLDGFSKVVNLYGEDQAAMQGYVWEPVDLHAQMMEAIDPALEDIREGKESVEDEEVAQLVSYEDDGRTVGLALMVDNGAGMTPYISVISLQDVQNTALSVNLMGSMQLIGSGTVVDGIANGSYKLYISMQEMLYIDIADFDTTALEKGELDGSVQLRISQRLLEQMGAGIPADLLVVCDLEGSAKAMKTGYKVYVDTEMLFAVEISSVISEGATIEIPENVISGEDQEALMSWVQNMDMEGVLDNLSAAGVPSQLVEALRQSIENALSGGTAYEDSMG